MKKILLLSLLLLLPTNLLAAENAGDAAEHFPKQAHALEASPFVGSYLGRTVGQTWIAGGSATYHFTPTFAFGGTYGISKVYPDSSSTFGANLQHDMMHLATGELQISNDTLFRMGKKWLPMDFFMSVGAGAMNIDQKWKPTGLLGGGVKFFTKKPWLTIHIDVNNYLHQTPQPGRDRLDFDVAFVAGFSFFFPPLHR